jgi:hypothetical protein
MEAILANAGFDEDSLREIATSGNPGAEGVATRATTGAVMSAAAQNSHAEAEQSFERVERLVEMIPDMEDLKASMDHNTVSVRSDRPACVIERWSRKFGPAVKMDRMMKVTIQNDKTKEPFARIQSPCCA